VIPICEVRDGWLMEASMAPRDASKYNPDLAYGELRDGRAHTPWVVPPRGAPHWMIFWSPGPTYDFDGDGHPEPSTLWHGSMLEIWFSGGRQPSFSVLALNREPLPDDRWASWNGQIVYLAHDEQSHLHAFGFRPGEARHEIAAAACQLAAPGEVCATAAALPRSLPHTSFREAPQERAAAVLGAHPTRATCAQLDDAAKIQHARVIEHAMLRRLLGNEAIAPLAFTWGCVSHGEAPVVAHAELPSDAGAAELWTIRGGRPRFERAAHWQTPSVGAEFADIALASHGDLDGDGFDESIVAEATGTPLTARYSVTLAGARRALPSDVVVRGADGARDGIARLLPLCWPGAPGAPSAQVSPAACLPSAPANGRWPVAGEVEWDWEHEPPQILVWHGARFAPISASQLAAIVAETAAARAAQPRP